MSPKEIITRFGLNANQIVPANGAPTNEGTSATGGFSGAGVWKATGDDGQSFSIKRFSNVTADHLTWIHRVLLHANRVCDCDFVAAPLKTPDGNSFIESDGGLWEVCKWMPGKSDFHANPSDDRLTHAMQSLARFHQSAAQVNFDFRPSPGIQLRFEGMEGLSKTLVSIEKTPSGFPTLQKILTQLKHLPTAQIQNQIAILKSFSTIAIPLQPAIRDLWHDHLLFTGDRLTGLIDFDATQMDSIALDLTRCLGSIVPGDTAKWTFALDAYSSVRPIQQSELDLIQVLEPINLILSAANWLKWIVLEQRQFNAPTVEARLQTLTQQLSRLF